jgi:hypothetical protein
MTAPLFWLRQIGGVLKRIPWQAYAILAVLAVWYWDRERHADNREAEVRAEEQAAHNVTKASLEALAGDLSRMVQEGEERALRVSEAKERANREAVSLRQDIARLKRADTSDPCVTPREVLEAGL